jgi:glucokinase
MGFAIGVDLGGTNLRIAAVDESGALVEKVTTGTQVKRGRDAVIDDMVAAIRALTSKFQGKSKLLGVGIGVPGIIDKYTGMVRESPNLPGWSDYPVRDVIEQKLQTPIFLENDANVAALGENWLGAAKGNDDVCMITLGTGVGGGLVLRQRVWHGMTGMAGEIGHMTVDPNGPRCGCGSFGCLEAYASATAVVRMAREAIAGGQADQLKRTASDDAEFSARSVFNLALQGDGPARQIFAKVGWALGIGLANLINLLNLRMYVIGGGVSAGWQAFAPTMFEEVFRRCFVYAATVPDEIQGPQEGASAELKPLASARRTIITRALLGSDAGLYGAARLPMLGVEMTEHAHIPAFQK